MLQAKLLGFNSCTSVTQIMFKEDQDIQLHDCEKDPSMILFQSSPNLTQYDGML